MLTILRNAAQARHRRADVPASGVKEEVLKVLQRENYIKSYRRIEDEKQGILRVYLKYGLESDPVISHLKRISTPGRRVYVGRAKIPRIRNGLGTAILSTPRGVLTDREAREAGVGGELMAEVW